MANKASKQNLIDDKNYLLNESNYYGEDETLKYQIIIGNTGRNTLIDNNHTDFSYFNAWKLRRNGKHKENAMFSIDTFGKVYQHFNPRYWSEFIENSDVNQNIISIALHNEGLLKQDNLNNKFYGWENLKYSNINPPVYKQWRNNHYWASYTKEQYKSLSKLLIKLCDEFHIPKKLTNHNTIIDGIENFEGICTKANYDFEYTDVSPAFEWDKIKLK